MGDMARLLVDLLPQYLRRADLLLVVGAVLVLVYGQYLRIARVEGHLFGTALTDPRQQMLEALVTGGLGGVLATLLFVFVGMPLSGAGVMYIWVVALVLAVLHPRFLCFSYAGGLVGLAHLLFGFPAVDVSAVVALVAALHLVEAFLIAFAGAGGATPVYVRSRRGSVVGGFLLQKFWPIPFVALVAGLATMGAPDMGREIAMPLWWPLIKPGLRGGLGSKPGFGVLPVVAALGYSDVAITRRPAEKARHTAALLVVYSLALLALGVLAGRHPGFSLLAVVFSPLGHEGVIALGRRRELLGEPVFVSGQGVMVLGVLPGSRAAAMELQPGDLIRRVNGEPIATKADLVSAMHPWAIDAELEVESAFSGAVRHLTCRGKLPPLGAILAPDRGEPFFIDPYRPGGLLRWWRAWRTRWAGGRTL
jgi:hypothetical protein